MLVTLSPFLERVSSSSKVSMKVMRRYLFTLMTGTYQMINTNNKFVTDPIPTSGLDFLNGLLIRVDMDYLLKYRNDIERLAKIEKMFMSPVFSSYIYDQPTGMSGFISSKMYETIEYYIPVRDVDTLSVLPLGSDDINDWLTLSPFRMISCPSHELSMDNLATKLKFSMYQPYETTFTVDICMLLLIYTKLLLLDNDLGGTEVNRYPFLYKSCVIPLLYDSSRAWLLDLYITMTENIVMEVDTDMTLNRVEIGKRGNFARVDFNKTMKEVRGLLLQCADGKVTPDTVVNSLSIRYGYNLFDEMVFLRDRNFVSGNMQFYWLTFLKEYELLRLIMNIYALQLGSSRYDNMIKLLRRKVRRLNSTKFWQHASNPNLVENVKVKFESIANEVL